MCDLDWASSVRPLLAASYGKTSAIDLYKLANTLIAARDELLSHESDYESFYSSLVSLAIHFLMSQCNQITNSQLPSYANAGRILVEYLVKKVDISHENCAINPQQLVALMRSLFTGRGCLQRSDVISLAAKMKSSQLPPHIRSTIGPDKPDDDGVAPAAKAATATGSSGGSISSPKSPSSRQRSTSGRFDALLTPLVDCLVAKPIQPTPPSTTTEGGRSPSEQRRTRTSSEQRQWYRTEDRNSLLLADENVACFVELEGLASVLDTCLQLPVLSTYKYEEFLSDRLVYPQTTSAHAETDGKALILTAEIEMITNVLELPLFDVISDGAISKLNNIACSCVLASAFAVYSRLNQGATDNEKQTDDVNGEVKTISVDEADCTAVTLTRLSHKICKGIVEKIRTAFTDVYKADRVYALLTYLSGKILKRFMDEFKILNIGSLDVAELFLWSCGSFLGNVKYDTGSKAISVSVLNASTVASPSQKFVFICRNLPLLDLIISLVCRTLEEVVERETTNATSIATTVNCVDAAAVNGTMDGGGTEPTTPVTTTAAIPPAAQAVATSVSVDSDGPEAILGSWLEELMCVPQIFDEAIKQQAASLSVGLRQRSLAAEALNGGTLSDSKPPSAKLLRLAHDALETLNGKLFGGASGGPADSLRDAVGRGLAVDTLTDRLLTLVRLLNRTEGLPALTEDQDMVLIDHETSKLIHNLLLAKYPSDSQQVALVSRLAGCNLMDEDGGWVTKLPQRTLSVIGQILFLKMHRETRRVQLATTDCERLIVTIWSRFVDTLREALLCGLEPDTHKPVVDPANPAHIQLLTALAYSIQLNDRKGILLKLARTLLTLVDDETHTKFLSRRLSPHLGHLLLLFEFFIRHLLEPPADLVDHVMSNVFPTQCLEKVRGFDKQPRFHAMEIHSRELSRRNLVDISWCLELSAAAVSQSSTTSSRLDGFAVNALLGWGEGGYCRLYSALLTLNGRLTLTANSAASTPLSDAGAADEANVLAALYQEQLPLYYTKTILWRLLGCLPVSVGFLKAITADGDDVGGVDDGWVLQRCRLAARFDTKDMQMATLDALTKQTLTEDQAAACFDQAKVAALDTNKLLTACTGYITRFSSDVAASTTANDWAIYRQLTVRFADLLVVLAQMRCLLDHGGILFADTYQKTDYQLNVIESEAVMAISTLFERISALSRRMLVTYALLSVDSANGTDAERKLYDLALQAVSLFNGNCVASVSVASAKSASDALREAGLDPLSAAVEAWHSKVWSADMLDFPKSRFDTTKVSVPESSEKSGVNPIEKQINLIRAAATSALTAYPWRSACLALAQRSLAVTLGLMTDLLCQYAAENRDSTAPVPSVLSERILLPALLSAHTPQKAAQRAKFVLSDVLLRAQVYALEISEKKSGRFLDTVLEILTCLNESPKPQTQRYFCRKLAGHISNPANWGAWASFLNRKEARPTSFPIYSIAWLDFLQSVFDLSLDNALLDDSAKYLLAIKSKLLDVHLESSNTLSLWLKVLRENCVINKDDPIARFDAENFLNSFLHKLSSYFATDVKQANEGSQIAVLNALLTSVINSLPAEEPEMTQYRFSLPRSDRWNYAKLTPLSTGGNSTERGCGLDRGFQQAFQTAVLLADRCTDGHPLLLQKVRCLLSECQSRLSTSFAQSVLSGERVVAKTDNEQHQLYRLAADIDTGVFLLNYVTTLISALNSRGSKQEQFDSRILYDSDTSVDDTLGQCGGTGDEHDSSDVEDPVGEENLDNKLCTFTVTQKEFMNQHWYHCHTCDMVDGEGVCTVCAKVCHKGHDLSYSKFGSFFCDCGARQASFCFALSKRVRKSKSEPKKTAKTEASSISSADGGKKTLKTTSEYSHLMTDLTLLKQSCYRITDFVPFSFQLASKDWTSAKRLAVENALKSELARDYSTVYKDVSLYESILTLVRSLRSPILTGVEESRSATVAHARRQEALQRLHREMRSLAGGVIATDYDRILVSHVSGTQPGAVDSKPAVFVTAAAVVNGSGAAGGGGGAPAPPSSTEAISSEQGQQIRQAMATHVLLRSTAVPLYFVEKQRRYLVICQDRSKVCTIQSNSLVKQLQGTPNGGTSKKKTAIQRTSQDVVPFTVLSMSSNDLDCVAVCGIKDCQVFVYSSAGTVAYKIPVPLVVASNECIVNSLWSPVERGLFAVITSSGVSVFNLTVDAAKPLFHFVLPQGNIRDATFVCQPTNINDEKEKDCVAPTAHCSYLLVLSSLGYVYWQPLNDEAKLSDGSSFYITNVLALEHPDLQDNGVGIAGGGQSIHYSHSLSTLFLSYQSGRNLMIPLTEMKDVEVTEMATFYLTEAESDVQPAGKVTAVVGLAATPTDALVRRSVTVGRWTEVSGYPGVLLATATVSARPFLLYFGPDSAVFCQEIVSPSAKSKIYNCLPCLSSATSLTAAADGDDTSTGTSSSGGDDESTLAGRLHLLAFLEDGACHLFASNRLAPPDYWLESAVTSTVDTGARLRRQLMLLPPPLATSTLPSATAAASTAMLKKKPTAAHHSTKKRRAGGIKGKSITAAPAFPPDFFETCQQIQDVEFGGDDFLRVYDRVQLKNRLNTPNLYVSCSNRNGFEVTVRCRDDAVVVCGVRIELGKHTLERSPTYIELFSRRRQTDLTRPRWIDIPFTREETYAATAGTFSIKFGSSSAQQPSTVVDSIRVHGKTKEAFGWADDDLDASPLPNTVALLPPPPPPRLAWASHQSSVTATENADRIRYMVDASQPTLPELLLFSAFDCLDRYSEFAFSLHLSRPSQKLVDLSLPVLQSSSLHVAPVQKVKSVLRRVAVTREAYYNQKDHFLLNYAIEGLSKAGSIDAYTRVLAVIREILARRPHKFFLHFQRSNSNESMKPEISPEALLFLERLVAKLWSILATIQLNRAVSSVGIEVPTNLQDLIRGLIEILYFACQFDPDACIELTERTIGALLLSKLTVLSDACRQTLATLLRPAHSMSGRSKLVLSAGQTGGDQPMIASPAPSVTQPKQQQQRAMFLDSTASGGSADGHALVGDVSAEDNFFDDDFQDALAAQPPSSTTSTALSYVDTSAAGAGAHAIHIDGLHNEELAETESDDDEDEDMVHFRIAHDVSMSVSNVEEDDYASNPDEDEEDDEEDDEEPMEDDEEHDDENTESADIDHRQQQYEDMLAAAVAEQQMEQLLMAAQQGDDSMEGVVPAVAPPDDEAAMVELAIALSLQEGNADVLAAAAAAVAANGVPAAPVAAPLATAEQSSPPADDAAAAETGTPLVAIESATARSDDESTEEGSDYDDDVGSTAATDGSTLRTASPSLQAVGGGIETTNNSVGGGASSGAGSLSVTGGERPAGGGGSESGGSVSGRSSDGLGDVSSSVAAMNTSALEDVVTVCQQPPVVTAAEGDALAELVAKQQRSYRVPAMLLRGLLRRFPEQKPTEQVNDRCRVHYIAYMQSLLLLLAELDGNDESHRELMADLLTKCVGDFSTESTDFMKRTCSGELSLLKLRLLSVLLSKVKGREKPNLTQAQEYLALETAALLVDGGAVEHCRRILTDLLPFWKTMALSKALEERRAKVLTHRCNGLVPDRSPFFLRQYVREHSQDVFECYSELLTEMALRLPYQIRKVKDSRKEKVDAFITEDQRWERLLCDYVSSCHDAPFVRRQARKLLLVLAGSRDDYRFIRDRYLVETQLDAIKDAVKDSGDRTASGGDRLTNVDRRLTLNHMQLNQMMERLKIMMELAENRPAVWQRLCASSLTKSADNDIDELLQFLIRLGCVVNDVIGEVVLTLIERAFCVTKSGEQQKSSTHHRGSTSKDKKQATTTATTDDVPKKDGDNDDVSRSLLQSMTERILSATDRGALLRFLTRYLLQSNMAARRAQTHKLLAHMFEYGTAEHRRYLVDLMWQELWPHSHLHGHKATHLVDLMSYFTRNTLPSDQLTNVAQQLLRSFREDSERLVSHPNANLYSAIGMFVDCDAGFYLELNPCFVCANPETPFTSIKLSSVKWDTRSTTSAYIVKMVGSHEMSRIAIRFSDLKRQKMAKTVNIYYSNKPVPSAVDLRNRPDLWWLAKRLTLTAGQTDVKADLAVPIVACNMMLEFVDFFDVQRSATEQLHCPRCSANVPANPGVCGNCGENVYQCTKCRSINYDERDPFLCNSCGHSKYAKFDVSFIGRPTATAEPIENEDDRKRALSNIDGLLEAAENKRKQLHLYRSSMEALLAAMNGVVGLPTIATITHHRTPEATADTTAAPPPQRKLNNAGVAVGSARVSAVSGLTASAGTSSVVNDVLQAISQRYSKDCKDAFEELKSTIWRITAHRSELLEYDAKQGRQVSRDLLNNGGYFFCHTECYGCIAAHGLHCVQLLRSLSLTLEVRRSLLTAQDDGKGAMLIGRLVTAMRVGPRKYRTGILDLLCELTKNDEETTVFLCSFIERKVREALLSDMNAAAIAHLIYHEMQMLRASCKLNDRFWERRLKTAVRLLLTSLRSNNKAAIETVTFPCMELLRSHINSSIAGPLNDTQLSQSCSHTSVDSGQWLTLDRATTSTATAGDHGTRTSVSFDGWLQDVVKDDLQFMMIDDNRSEAREGKQPLAAIVKRCALNWVQKWRTSKKLSLSVSCLSYLQKTLMCPNSAHTRASASTILRLVASPSSHRTCLTLELLTKHIDFLTRFGDVANEFFSLYRELLNRDEWRLVFANRKLISKLGDLITKEVERLGDLESKYLCANLSEGCAIKMLATLLQDLLSVPTVRQRWKADVLGAVLHGYLGLRRLLVQRTKLIDDAEVQLLATLEDLTTGTEAETREFMTVCVKTLERYPLSDMKTPVFIFERLCSIIRPTEKEVGTFLINIEKDPAQEDFLQGRMMNNPYGSADPGMGPLMRDIKNKICRDCELVALLEDDTGMELLVNGKIVSLDLPVADVYRRLWQPERNGEAMLVVYRMRGLLGDATEEFVQTLQTNKDSKEDEEETFRLAKDMAENGGLTAMLSRLSSIRVFSQGRSMLAVLLRLCGYCVKVRVNRRQLNSLGTVAQLVSALQLIVNSSDSSAFSLIEELLDVVDSLLVDANARPPAEFKEFADAGPKADQIRWLLSILDAPSTLTLVIQEKLTRLVPNLSLGSEDRMKALVDHYRPCLDYKRIDDTYGATADTNRVGTFCAVVKGIYRSEYGSELKARIISADLLKDAIEYLLSNHPPLFKVTIDAPEWKDFLTRPSLAFILQLMAGMSQGDKQSQTLVAADCIPLIHRLEQISTEQCLGTQAENVMEALRENKEVAEKIERVRKETRQKRKEMAIKMRNKQLEQMGMKIGEKGVVEVTVPKLQDAAADLSQEEEGAFVCSICLEGYRTQPGKVLGVYTFSKRVNADDYDSRPRKQPAYSTVTHMNIVHFDCHQHAIKAARGRGEWESAMLHNANTKCNGVLPFWGPDVPESNFANCLARFNADLQQHTNCGDVTFASSVHDLKLLLMRFAQRKSFSEESGGGGQDSNIQLIPCILQLALYVLNTTRLGEIERSHLDTFLAAQDRKQWIDSGYMSEGPLYMAVLSMLLLSNDNWEAQRMALLRRLIVTAHVRKLSAAPASDIVAKNLEPAQWTDYAVLMTFFGLINELYRKVFKKVTKETATVPAGAVAAVGGADAWPEMLLAYLRRHHQSVSDDCRAVLHFYQQELIAVESFDEFCDVLGLYESIPSPSEFLKETISSLRSAK